jgi:hypothetical protein
LQNTACTLLQSLLESNDFTASEQPDWNLFWVNTSDRPQFFQNLNEFQKINHFPLSTEITRKDRLCHNYVRQQQKYGRDNFDFIPDTYCLPKEQFEFK